MMGKATQMSKHSEDDLQETLKSFTQLKLDDSKRDTDESELPDQIEDVDLVVDDRLSRASTPVFYLGSDA